MLWSSCETEAAEKISGGVGGGVGGDVICLSEAEAG